MSPRKRELYSYMSPDAGIWDGIPPRREEIDFFGHQLEALRVRFHVAGLLDPAVSRLRNQLNLIQDDYDSIPEFLRPKISQRSAIAQLKIIIQVRWETFRATKADSFHFDADILSFEHPEILNYIQKALTDHRYGRKFSTINSLRLFVPGERPLNPDEIERAQKKANKTRGKVDIGNPVEIQNDGRIVQRVNPMELSIPGKIKKLQWQQLVNADSARAFLKSHPNSPQVEIEDLCPEAVLEPGQTFIGRNVLRTGDSFGVYVGSYSDGALYFTQSHLDPGSGFLESGRGKKKRRRPRPVELEITNVSDEAVRIADLTTEVYLHLGDPNDPHMKHRGSYGV